MAFCREPCSTNSTRTTRNGLMTLYAASDCNEVKIKSFLTKMIWEFGFGCLLPGGKKYHNNGEKKGSDLEHNKAWLLADSAGGGGAELNNTDPQSVHSSFRFSFCSQVGLEDLAANPLGSDTILMVNLDNKESKLRKIESLERSISPVANSLVRFSYGEIVSATKNFSQGRVLGRGGMSFVFSGRVGLLKTTVAIKRLDKDDKESAKAFCRELMIASSLHHSNIVPLLGFCIDPEGGLFLVYKFVSGGSLEHHLHDKKKGIQGGSSSLPWCDRYKVALGIAEAIAYLHNGTEKCVVHRDIKPSNILLSSKKSPKLCDFGIATWRASPSIPFLCRSIKGTFGYLAPEYFQHGKISDKTDVYAFGVVLLELLTGRKPIEARRPAGEENLVLWAKPLLHRGMASADELLDPGVKRTLKNSAQIARTIQAAAACISDEESQRPSMDEIIAILRGEEEPFYSIRKKSSFSGIINCYPQLKHSESEVKSHLALAMVGVSEVEEVDHLYSR